MFVATMLDHHLSVYEDAHRRECEKKGSFRFVDWLRTRCSYIESECIIDMKAIAYLPMSTNARNWEFC